MSEVADLYVTLRARTAQFNEAMARAGAEGEATGTRIRKGLATTGLLVGASLLAGGVAAVKMASEFQASMQRMNTLAMGGKGNINQLSNAVLGLAGQVGYSPNSLAEALYHIESNFYSVGLGGKQALTALKVAAEGAQIGGANLVDVTNALGAVIASGIPGIHSYQQAMQDLLTTVGSGDMTMQNLADALSTGLLAIGKQYGVTITDIGASLATLGDNNIRGAHAATMLRMSIMDLAVQSKAGAAALAQYGIRTGELAADLRTGGLDKALTDLRTKLAAAGITGTRVGAVLAKAFTKRSSAPLAVLLGEFDRLQSKYRVITKSANDFGSAWSARLHTTQQQWDDLKATLEAGLIRVGTALLPLVTKALQGLNAAFAWLGQHKDVLYALAGGAAALVATGLAAWVVDLVNPFTLLVTGIFAVGAGLTYLYEHSQTFRSIINGLASTIRDRLGEAFNWLARVVFPLVQAAWSNVLAFFSRTFGQLAAWWQQHSNEIQTVVSTLWDWVGTYVGASFKILEKTIQVGWRIGVAIFKTTFDLIKNLVAMALDLLTGHWSKFFNDLRNLIQQGLTDAWNSFTTILGGLFSWVGTWLSQMWGAFSKALGTLASDAVQWGENIIQGLIKGIEGAVGGLLNTVKGMASGIGNAFKSVLGIFSPSKVFQGFGLNIGQGLAKGILASQAMVQAATRKLGSLVTDTYTKRGHLHQSWTPEHSFIEQLEKSFTADFKNLTHSRDAISKFSHEKTHKNAAGRAQALAAYKQLHTDLLRVEHQIAHARTQVLHDPHSTRGERSRINTEYREIRTQLTKANELHRKLLTEQINQHKKVRREGARKAIAGDLPTYLEAAAAAGFTTFGQKATSMPSLPARVTHAIAPTTALTAVLTNLTEHGHGRAITHLGHAIAHHHRAVHALRHAAAHHHAATHHTRPEATRVTVKLPHTKPKPKKETPIQVKQEIRVLLDGKEVWKQLQTETLRHERRNTSNGMSRRRSAKK